MDLRFTPDEVSFREDIRQFLAGSLPAAIREGVRARRHISREHMVQWQRILNQRGWAVPAWPKEWGGTGWSAVQRYLFTEALHSEPAPEPLSFNVNMLGPVLIAFGSEAQKRRFLPRIANLDDWWCQGFSEPGAGSDLASLRTQARREGDVYIVNGQKMWTTLGHFADWMFCLVRTDSQVARQRGISMLLIDMRSPGVTVRPIVTLDGSHETNEVYLDDVRVPIENLVGAENAGWTYAKFLLGNERTGIARVGVSRERLAWIRALAPRVEVGGKPLSERASFRQRLTSLEVELKALEMTQLRVVAKLPGPDARPDPASSILKIKGSELQQATYEFLLDVAGPACLPLLEHTSTEALPAATPEWAEPVLPSYLYSRVFSIYGGSNEIQKNIIAKGILGL